MTDKDIETIITTAIHNSESVAVDWTGIRDEASGEIEDLEALRAYIAAMREIVQAVATEDTCAYEGDAGDDVHCVFCQSEDDWREARARNELHHIVHTPDCPVTKARTLLSAE